MIFTVSDDREYITEDMRKSAESFYNRMVTVHIEKKKEAKK